MKEKETFMNYEAPRIEIVEVEIEGGFAVSVDVRGYNDGGSLGDYDLE